MSDYIKIQNEGAVSTDLRLVYEMMNAGEEFHDVNGYFSKRNIAKIAAASLLITSAGKMEHDLLAFIDDTSIKETDNPILQNVKLIMQNLRMLGIVSADYDSESYAINKIGKLVINDIYGPSKSRNLLRELFMNINTTTEIYDHGCSPVFKNFLGYMICYAFAKLDYRISTKEMPILTTYSIEEINQFVDEVKILRASNNTFSTDHPHFPRTNKGKPIKNPSNLTRKTNQLLRFCNIIEPKPKKIGKYNYYVCTNFGEKYIDLIYKKFKKLTFLSSTSFRKKNLEEQRDIVAQGIDNLLIRSGKSTPGAKDNNVVFSPYQMIPETCVNWFIGEKIRKKPESSKSKTAAINSNVTSTILRIHANFSNDLVIDNLQFTSTDKILRDYIKEQQRNKISIEELAHNLAEMHKEDDKTVFYPFVYTLLNLIGINCENHEVGRIDGYGKYKDHIIPVEIKSYTETHTFNMKGIRQSIENKICTFNPSLENDIKYSSIVVGFESPINDTRMVDLIESAHNQWHIQILATDIYSLLKICIRKVWEGKEIDLDSLLTDYGFINE